jgi:hypothetical protein
MISTRRIVAVLGLAAGVTGLAAPAASAADAGSTPLLSPMATLDSLAVTDLPEEYKDDLPPLSAQLAALNQAHELGRLMELAGPVAPVLNLVPAVQ